MADDYYSPQTHTQQMPLQNSQQYQPQYQQQYQPQYQQYPPQYQQPHQHVRMPSDETTTTGQWVLNLFLVAIPLVGLILLFVWAFGSNTAPSKKNWARANLIWILIIIIVAVALSFISMAMGVDLASVYRSYYRFG